MRPLLLAAAVSALAVAPPLSPWCIAPSPHARGARDGRGARNGRGLCAASDRHRLGVAHHAINGTTSLLDVIWTGAADAAAYYALADA